MIEITLTQFVDFVLKSGSPKLTVVRHVKKQHADGYSPQTDFYKAIRDALVELHRRGQPLTALDQVLSGLTDKKKQTAYPALVKGYKKFAGRRALEWFAPPKKAWIVDDLRVSLNPELGLKIAEAPHLVKLYFKDGEPGKRQVEAMLCLLQSELRPKAGSVNIGLLDVRRGKLILPTNYEPAYLTLMEGEAKSFASIYRGLRFEG